MTAYELDHLAVAVETWAQAEGVLATRLGGRWAAGFHLAPMDVAQVSFDDDMRLELLAPGSDPASFVRSFLARRSPAAPHHVTFKVHDIRESLVDAATLGLEPILVRIDDERWREAFLHPTDTRLGFLVQLVQAAQDVTDFGSTDGSLRSAPLWADPRDPARAIPALVGRVRDLDRATTVLVDLLGAEVLDVAPGTRAYRWPSGADLVLELAHDARPGIHTLVVGDRARVELGPEDLAGLDLLPLTESIGLRIHDLAAPAEDDR